MTTQFLILVCAAGYTFEDIKCRACPADTFKSQDGNNITCTRCIAHSTTSEQKAQTSNTCGMSGQKISLEKFQLMLCFIIEKKNSLNFFYKTTVFAQIKSCEKNLILSEFYTNDNICAD